MIINFFNKDVRNARFEIRWGEDSKSPFIELNPGDMAAFDLDVFHAIPAGTDFSVYGYQTGTNCSKLSSTSFTYRRQRGFAGTFKFYMRGPELACKFYAA